VIYVKKRTNKKSEDASWPLTHFIALGLAVVFILFFAFLSFGGSSFTGHVVAGSQQNCKTVSYTEEICEEVAYTEQEPYYAQECEQVPVMGEECTSVKINYQKGDTIFDTECLENDLCLSWIGPICVEYGCSRARRTCTVPITNLDYLESGVWSVGLNFHYGDVVEKAPISKQVAPRETAYFVFTYTFEQGTSQSTPACTAYVSKEAYKDVCEPVINYEQRCTTVTNYRMVTKYRENCEPIIQYREECS